MVIVHWGLSPLRGHLHLHWGCSVLSSGQLSSAAAAALCTVGTQSLSAPPELPPTAALLSQIPLAWVCSASPETCES